MEKALIETSPKPQVVANREHYLQRLKQQLFAVEIADQRMGCGQVVIDMAPLDGALDDILSVCVEAAFLPGTSYATQAIHLRVGDGSDESTGTMATIYKVGDRLVLQPAAGQTLQASSLPDGADAYDLTQVAQPHQVRHTATIDGFDQTFEFAAPAGATQQQLQSCLVDAMAQVVTVEISEGSAQ